MSSNYFTYGTNLQNREFFTSTVNTPSGVKRYFSNVEGEIYFGNKLVEDIYKFDFVVEEKKLPLYGYNCFYPEAIIPGQRIVQGTFIVNFTNGNYINNILKEIDDSIMYNDLIENEIYNPSGEDRNLSIWPKIFDIMIGYGYYNTSNETYNATCQTICGVQLFNMQSIVDVSGDPIMEVYSFIAKDFINGDISSNEDDSNDKEEEEESNTDTKQNYIYADKNNNEDYTKKYNEYKNKKDSIGLVYDIKLFIDKDEIPLLSVIITDFDDNPIKCDFVSLLVNEQLNYNFTKYDLQKTSNNEFSISFKNIINEGNIIYEALKSKKYTKISCNLEYAFTLNSQEYKLKYDAFIYPDKSIK